MTSRFFWILITVSLIACGTPEEEPECKQETECPGNCCSAKGLCSSDTDDDGVCDLDDRCNGQEDHRFAAGSCTECSEKFAGEGCLACSAPHFLAPDCVSCTIQFAGDDCGQCAKDYWGESCNDYLFQQLSSGSVICGVLDSGMLLCWDLAGNLQPVPAGSFQQVAAGPKGQHCALQKNGRALCWADESGLELKSPNDNFAHIDTNGQVACGAKKAGGLRCWGLNKSMDISTPEGIFTQVSVGDYSACSKTENGAVSCWLALDKSTLKVPIAPPPPDPVVQLDVGAEAVGCGVPKSGELICWRSLETSASTAKLVTLDVPPGTFTQVALAGSLACARFETGEPRCWDLFEFGISGRTIEDYPAPSGYFVSFTRPLDALCGLRHTGGAECWTQNGSTVPTPRVP